MDRLEQLRAEFEAARSALIKRMYPLSGALAEIYLTGADEQWFASRMMRHWPRSLMLSMRAEEVADLARRYIIARDFGQYEPKKALMLWKLQNGGV